MGIKQSSIDRQRTEFGMDYLTMIDTLEITSNKSNLHIKTDLISKLWLSRPSPSAG